MSGSRDDLARLLRWYPPRWQERYGDELLALCEDAVGDRPPTPRFRASIAVAGLRERGHESGLVGRTASPAERTRTGALVVLCAWTLFVLGGASFAKLSEHAGSAVPAGSRWRIDLSYGGVEALAVIAGLSVLAGALVCLPPFVRYAKASGWSGTPSRLFVVATAITVWAVAGGIGLALWARHVSAFEREVGTWPYGAAFLAWAAIVAVAFVAWTSTAVVVVRRLILSPLQLRLCATLAHVVAIAMVLISVAVIVWWTQMPAEAPGSMFDLRLTVTVTAMALADSVAIVGLRRIEPV